VSVLLEAGKICLRHECPVEDAEPFLVLLQNNPECPVDIGGATNMHAAVLQLLLAFRRKVHGQPGDSFLQKWILPEVADPIDNGV